MATGASRRQRRHLHLQRGTAYQGTVLSSGEADTYEEVLDQIITVLFVSPCTESTKDVLDIFKNPLALDTDPCGARLGSATGLEGIRVENGFEQFGELLL